MYVIHYLKKKCQNGCTETKRKDACYFDDECKKLKHDYYDNLNLYRNNPCEATRVDMVHARSNYKNTLRKKKYIYDSSQSHKLDTARFYNAKQYWKMLRDSVVNNKCSLSSNDFLDYFKSINDPDSVFYQPDEDVLYFNERYVQGELDVMFSELNAPFVVNDIIKACKQLKNGKSAGPDYFINEFF